MKVEVTATNVNEFKPITINLSFTIENVNELSFLVEDIQSFEKDGGLSDSDAVRYSPITNGIVNEIFKSINPTLPKEEGKAKS